MLTIKIWDKLVLMALAIHCALLAGCTPPGARALLEGQQLIQQGAYPQAVEKLRTATSLLATNASAWNYLGVAYHYSGQAAQAEKAYQRSLSLDRNLAETHYNLGCLWLEANKFEAAKSELTTYTLRKGNSLEALLKLGTAQLYCREPAAAERSYAEALRLSPQNPEALNGIGVARLQRNRPGEAADFFRSATKPQPTYAPALLNLAIVSHQYLKDRQAALQTYRQYTALQPPPLYLAEIETIAKTLDLELAPPPRPVVTNVPPPVTLTNALVNTARPATSAATSVVASPKPPLVVTAPKPTPPTNTIKQQPVFVPPPTTSVEIVRLPAEPILKSAQDIPTVVPQPESKEAAVTQPLVNTSAPPAATTETKVAKRGLLQRINPLKLFRSDEKNPARPAPGQKPSDFQQTNVSKPAESQLASATNSPPPAPKPLPRYAYLAPGQAPPGKRSEAQAAFARGVEAQQSHKLDEAIQNYRSAVQSDPSYFEAYYNLGLAATEVANISAGLAAYENALAIQPNSLDARYNFALALKQANYPVDAANELEKVLASHPDEVRAHLAAGNLYAQQLHDLAKARRHYQRVLELEPHNPQANAIRYWLAANP